MSEQKPLHRRIATRIRARAEERDLPITYVADLAGVSRAGLFRVLSGDVSPTVGWLQKIAAALDCTAADLISVNDGVAVSPRRTARSKKP